MSFANHNLNFGIQSSDRLGTTAPPEDRYQALVEVSHSIASHPDLPGLFHDLLPKIAAVDPL